MDYKVVFRESFLADLEDIVGQIAAHNPTAALRLGKRIVSMGEGLAIFPALHPRVRQRPELRRYIVARHDKVFYRVLSESCTVEVLRCWDGRRATQPRNC